MRRCCFAALVMLSLVAFSPYAWSETRYVSDQLIITVREGKDLNSPRVANLRTDMPVEVLEEDERLLKVRTQDGVEGYVQKQYLSAEKPKSKIIEELQSELTRVKKQRRSLEGTTSSLAEEEKALKETIDSQEKDLGRLRAEIESITKEYDSLKKSSGNVLDIVAEKDRLESENASIQQEFDALKEENSTLLRTGMIKWFLAGGSVFFMGWISGKVSRKKRRF